LVIKDQQFFRNLAMIKSGANFNIYYWHHEGIFLMIMLYVDDLIITSNSKKRESFWACGVTNMTFKNDSFGVALTLFEHKFQFYQRKNLLVSKTLYSRGNNIDLKTFVDIDWIGDPKLIRSTSVYILKIGNFTMS
jgi:hypothetical protein